MPARRTPFEKGAARQYASQVDKALRTIDGIVFDSQAEMEAYVLVKKTVPEGYWQRQVSFMLLPKKRINTRGETELVRDMTWSCDFLIGPPYTEGQPLSDLYLVVDVKGMMTEQFKVKIKIFKWCWEHIPWIVDVSSQKKQWAFVKRLQDHCQYLGIK